jgi:ATP-dependent RNA helicase DDX5/DBP2
MVCAFSPLPALRPRLPLTFMQSYNGYSNGYGGGGYGGGYGGYGGGYDDRMSNLGGSLRSVDWSSAKLEHFEKNFYVEDKRVSSHSDREIEDFRREKEIKVRLVSPLTRFFH